MIIHPCIKIRGPQDAGFSEKLILACSFKADQIIRQAMKILSPFRHLHSPHMKPAYTDQFGVVVTLDAPLTDSLNCAVERLLECFPPRTTDLAAPIARVMRSP